MESFPNRSHNFVIDLAHRGVSVAQWLEHRSAESEGLRFDSSWGLRDFSLFHARDKTENILPLSNCISFVFTEIRCRKPRRLVMRKCPAQVKLGQDKMKTEMVSSVVSP